MSAKIVVYSWTGNTAACAVALQQASGIEPFLLVEAKERAGSKGFAKGGMQASLGMKTALKELPDLTDVSTLVLGMPVWAGTTPPAINTFFQKCNVCGKRVYAFVTQASEEVPQRLETKLKKLVEKQGGEWVHMFVVSVPRSKQLSVEEALPRAEKWAARILKGE
ncbi:hypothetical protein LJC07_02750 [Christensenellaceae bacterium OttesenSCG-928-L17]|nr:hypothetical protein [Christensenellaceae bacterium OttesenSCG-928-L17]